MSLAREYLQQIKLHHAKMGENKLQDITHQFHEHILPALLRLKLTTIPSNEAVNLCIKLFTSRAQHFLAHKVEFNIPDASKIQGLSQLANIVFKPENNPAAEQACQLLKNIFLQFPETSHIPELNDLLLQAQLIVDDESNQFSAINFVKGTFALNNKIPKSYLLEALAAFNQWVVFRKTYAGVLCQVIVLLDNLAQKYFSIKNLIINFGERMFRHALNNEHVIPRYFLLFETIINTLISLDEKEIVELICNQITKAQLDPWLLIEIFDHPAFKQFSLSQRRIILNLLNPQLNNKQIPHKTLLRFILDKCINPAIRIPLVRRLSEFYTQPVFPPLTTLVEWIKLMANDNPENLANTLEASYIIFHNDRERRAAELAASHTLINKQLNKLKSEMEAYQHTSWHHTRKQRAGYLSNFSAKQLADIEKKDLTETQRLMQQTIAELYLHYATIEDASSKVSRSLEKRLIKLLKIPNDDRLCHAETKREGFIYKLNTFFRAGRSCIKIYRDKDKDPVHEIIWQNISPTIKAQIKNLRREILQLDQQDQLETAFLHASSLASETLTEIGGSISHLLPSP